MLTPLANVCHRGQRHQVEQTRMSATAANPRSAFRITRRRAAAGSGTGSLYPADHQIPFRDNAVGAPSTTDRPNDRLRSVTR